jgi:hypothetical protein
MSTELLHGQMSVVDAKGNVTVLHQETSASDVLVNNESNTQGDNGSSAIPSDVNTLQKLTDKIGKLAFKSNFDASDLPENLIVNNYTTTEEGHALDARAGKDLNERVKTIEDSEYVYIEDSEDNEVVLPESEINDEIVSETLTWSSDKINELIQNILNDSHVFYIPLIEGENESYTSQKTVEEIEEAYQANYPIWVIASDIFLPLRQRVDANNWIFSGYADGRAYDIQISNTGVSITYAPVATLNDTLPNPNVLKVKGVVNAVYDGSEEVEIEIPEVIKDEETGVETTWSSDKINKSIADLQVDLQTKLNSHVHKWEDLENRPFGTFPTDTLTIDCTKVNEQVETGEATIANETFVHVSDYSVSITDLANGLDIVKNDITENITSSDLSELAEGVCVSTNGNIAFITEDGVGNYIDGEGNNIFPKAGIYVSTTYITDAESISIIIPNYTGFSAIKTLDPIYLPESIRDGGNSVQDISIDLDPDTHVLTVSLKDKDGNVITQSSATLEGLGSVNPEDLAPVATSGSFNDLKHKPSFVMDVDDEGVLSFNTIYSYDDEEYLNYTKNEDETGLDITQAVSATVNNNELEVK